MTKYRLQSTPMIHTPGLVAWARNGWVFEEDRPKFRQFFREGYGLPDKAVTVLIEGPYTIEGETVIIEVP